MQNGNILHPFCIYVHNNPNFANDLKKKLKNLMLTGLEKTTFNSKSIVALEYMISGLVGVICMWITDSEKLEVL